jgi:glycosyltransferase involved in cell wall biosynthesis
LSAIKIGTNGFGYTQNRNFAGVALQKYEFEKTPDLFSALKVAYRRPFGRPPRNLRIWHFGFGLSRYRLHHFFNTISFDATPWISTFGRQLPRHGGPWRMKIGVPLLARPACKKLIATSECARNAEIALLSNFPDYADEITPKLCVLHPPQRLEIDTADAKPLPKDHVECTFIGNAFYRKGGRELLIAFDRLWGRGYPLVLNIVSSFSIDSSGTRYHRNEQTIERTNRLIEKNIDKINVMKNLPNSEVIDLLRRSHVGLLPTYFDAYGYSALETLAAGCALVSTNVMALSEVNDSSCGWLIDVPCDSLGYPKLRSEKELDDFSSILTDGIENSIADAVENSEALRSKCETALLRIRRNHDPQQHANTLEAIYDEILSTQ